MTRRLAFLACLLAAGLLLCQASAASAAKGPVVKSVSPMHARVGETLTIRGRGFNRRAARNTVIFRSRAGRSLFVKPKRASRTKLVIVLPNAIERILTKGAATRLRLRVLAGRFGRFTSPRRSPVISPAGRALPSPGGVDCDRDGTPNSRDPDDDNDFMSDATETETAKTDPCDADTDGDGMEDAFEYESALDLNSRNLPYPGRRPYPNALDPGDAGYDFDGDGLASGEEHAAWLRSGRPSELSYSDGRQLTGVAAPPPAGRAYLDLDGDGALSDEEKDVDGDGIGNWDEIRGRMSVGQWPAYSSTPPVVFLQPEFTVTDTDGDGVVDGDDDQDHDDFSNLVEMTSVPAQPYPYSPGADPNDYHPFDPCKPDPNSRTCTRH